MGCFFRSIGCVVVLMIGAVVAWVFRDRIPYLHRDAPPATATAPASAWEPLTPEGAARAKSAVATLSTKSGPVFANVKGADLASYVFQELSKQLPASSERSEAAIIGDQLCVRASVKVADFGGAGALGPLGSMLGDRETVQFCGSLEVFRPGLAEYHVKELRIRDLSLPAPIIPRLLRKIEHGGRPSGLADDALPLKVPPYIADVRIGKGKITLYKTTS